MLSGRAMTSTTFPCPRLIQFSSSLCLSVSCSPVHGASPPCSYSRFKQICSAVSWKGLLRVTEAVLTMWTKALEPPESSRVTQKPQSRVQTAGAKSAEEAATVPGPFRTLLEASQITQVLSVQFGNTGTFKEGIWAAGQRKAQGMFKQTRPYSSMLRNKLQGPFSWFLVQPQLLAGLRKGEKLGLFQLASCGFSIHHRAYPLGFNITIWPHALNRSSIPFSPYQHLSQVKWVLSGLS